MKTRFFRSFLFDYDKEEEWLNRMAGKGLDLSACNFGFYYFKNNPNTDFIYKIRLLDYGFRHPESALTLRNIRNSDSELLFVKGRKIYLRKKRASGDFDRLEDLSSRMKHYKNIRSSLLFIFILVAVLLTFLIKMGIDHHISYFFWICVPITTVSLPIIPATFTIFRKIHVLKNTMQYIEYDRYPTEL